MSIIGTPTGDGRVARRRQDTSGERIALGGKSPADKPSWLLWSAGIIAFVLAVAAFVLWGINGASTLFDMVVALCA